MPVIVSTLSSTTVYSDYETPPDGKGAAVLKRGIEIKGGAGVAQPNTIINGMNSTPAGFKTDVTEEELEFLLNDNTFKTHLKHGFVKVLERDVKVKEVVKDMEKADASAPLTEADYKKDGKGRSGRTEAPKIGKVQ